MAHSLVSLSLVHDARARVVVLAAGLPVADVEDAVAASFDLGGVSGLCDSNGTLYPLDVVAQHPHHFAQGRFLVVAAGSARAPARPQQHSASFRRLMDFQELDVQETLRIFSQASHDGRVDKRTFMSVFASAIGMDGSESAQEVTDIQTILSNMFELFDRDSDGTVDDRELLGGLSVLCGGDRDSKVVAAFNLYDSNGDGVIELSEMTSYLTSVFRVIRQGNPEVFSQHGTTPDELGAITARQCFVDAGKIPPESGSLSFLEFKRWYESVDIAQTARAVAPSLEELREITGFSNLDPEDVFQVYADAADPVSRTLDLTAFLDTSRYLVTSSGVELSSRVDAALMALFTALDADGDHALDFSELASGISVLCGGTRSEKISAAFSLFDTNGDGFITPSEMITYLTSVFRVLYATDPSAEARMGGASPEQLALATSNQCFQQADANGDGQLSFEEFAAWYTPDAIPSTTAASTRSSIAEMRLLTGLERFSVDDVMEHFAQAASARGSLNRAEFEAALQTLAPSFETQMDALKASRLRRNLFDMWDTNGDSQVDFLEVVAGLSLLTGSTASAKLQAVFDVMDCDKDGRISLLDLTVYLESTYKLLYGADPTLEATIGVSPSELASITARSVFEEYDTDRNNSIDIHELKNWLDSEEGAALVAVSSKKDGESSMAHVRALLKDFSIQDLFEIVASSADHEGWISAPAFVDVFGRLASRAGTVQERRALDKELQCIFELFDKDNDRRVSFEELSAGLSVLCGVGSKGDAAFALFSRNGFTITLNDATVYLTTVFRVLLAAGSTADVSPERLAADTATALFVEADLDGNGEVDLEEWRKFVAKPQGMRLAQISEAASSTLSVSAAKRRIGLESLDAHTLISTIQKHMVNGVVDLPAFVRIFDSLAPTPEDPELRVAVARLFEALDQDGNGEIDREELGGLISLCGSSSDVKAKAAFELIDADGSGDVSEDELCRYFEAVFRVMAAEDPTSLNNQDPRVLAAATAAEAFKDADADDDGTLSWKEFANWMSRNSNGQGQALVHASDGVSDSHAEWLSIAEISRLTNFTSYSPSQLINEFFKASNGAKELTRAQFTAVCRRLVATGPKMSRQDKLKLEIVVDRLFDVMNADGNDVVDFNELAAGLSILTRGTRDEKVLAAFSLYDENNDGVISVDEMANYLSSVYAVLYDVNPGLVDEMDGLGPDALAQLTAEQAFEEMNMDPRTEAMTFEQFKRWYETEGREAFESSVEAPPPPPPKRSRRRQVAARTATTTDLSFEEIAKMTGLHRMNVCDVFEHFGARADMKGLLDEESFCEAFTSLPSKPSFEPHSPEQRRYREVLRKLFDAFDSNGDGVVDFTELASGLSVVTGGDLRERLAAAFALFDVDESGFIEREEMAVFLASIFTVQLEGNRAETLRTLGDLTVSECAIATTDAVFARFDADGDGRLSYEEFASFFASSDVGDNLTRAEHAIRSPGLEQLRVATGLACALPEDVFELVAERVSESGVITKPQFIRIMHAVAVSAGRPAEEARLHLEVLFDAADAAQTGFLSYEELACAVSVLCKGSVDRRASAAFKVLDLESRGAITHDELVLFLCTVFKLSLAFEDYPDVDAYALAASTARHIFAKCGNAECLNLKDFLTHSKLFDVENALSVTSISTTKDVKAMMGLSTTPVDEAFELFASVADVDGSVSREAFRSVLTKTATNPNAPKTQGAIDRLFDAFDEDDSGALDFTELATGLGVLCGGTRDEKLRSTFALYDYDGDGVIDREEFYRFVLSIFRVVYATEPGTLEKMGGVEATELAAAVTTQAFEEADTNRDGVLTFEEFKAWADDAGADFTKMSTAAVASANVSLAQVRRLTGLDKFTAEETFELFAQCANEFGALPRESFFYAFQTLGEAARVKLDDADKGSLNLVLTRLFDSFDADGDGFVDFAELSAGLSVLAGHDATEKAKAAFSVFDANGDGELDLDEMRLYLASVFRVLFELMPGEKEKAGGVSAEELAAATAEDAFERADADGSGSISLAEFVAWFTENPM